jgi:hypothetical protein
MKEVRADLKRRARISVGLPPENLPVNERESMEVALGYGTPKSRTQLMHERRERHLTTLEETRLKQTDGKLLTQVDRLRAREDADHLYRARHVHGHESIGHASRTVAREQTREDNLRDLVGKWQGKIDEQAPRDPNTYASSENRP